MAQDCEALLKLLLEKNIVKYLLMGKAISKAIRGNFLAESALNIFHVTIANFKKNNPQNVSRSSLRND